MLVLKMCDEMSEAMSQIQDCLIDRVADCLYRHSNLHVRVLMVEHFIP